MCDIGCSLNSGDPDLVGCSVQFPRNNTTGLVPSGLDGILAWDDSTPAYVHTGILPFQLENLVGRQLNILGALTPTTISTIPFGTFDVLVNPPAADFPTIGFTISKSDPTSNYAVIIVHTGVIPPSGNVLQVIWPAGGGIQIQKTLATEDGSYQITIAGV